VAAVTALANAASHPAGRSDSKSLIVLRDRRTDCKSTSWFFCEVGDEGKILVPVGTDPPPPTTPMAEEGTGGAGRAHFLVKVGDLSLSFGTWVMVDEGAGGAGRVQSLVDGCLEPT